MLHQYELFSDMSGKPSIKIADQTTDADPHLFNANVIMNVHHMYTFCNFFGTLHRYANFTYISLCRPNQTKKSSLKPWLCSLRGKFVLCGDRILYLTENVSCICRSNRSSTNEQNTVAEVVRKCNICQESEMVLRRKPVITSATNLFRTMLLMLYRQSLID